jgi:hypothetical protein
MIIDAGAFRVAIGVDLPEAAIHGVTFASGDLPGCRRAIGAARRAVVEVRRRVSGSPQLALLGGDARPPKTAGRLIVEVNLSGEASGLASCPGLLGRDLIPGLPNEFASGVVSGLLRKGSRPAVVSIDRGAHDLVESSIMAFFSAASVLITVLENENSEDLEGRVRSTLKMFA